MKIQYNLTIDYLKSQIPFQPLCCIILGTGLGNLTDEVEDKIEILYEDIPGFVKSTAPSHHGTLIAGYINKVPVIVLKGRFHYYEGYTMEQVVYPVRIAKLMGVKYLFVTNAAGSLNLNFKPGQLVRIHDHINMMGTNPLIGKNSLDAPINIDGEIKNEFGERFPSLHETYDKKLGEMASQICKDMNYYLPDGVYCAVTGPSLETKAECLMIKGFGADLVGMSTVPEVITAVHSGMKVFAVSVVTNLSNIFHSEPHSQEEIRTNADKASQNLLILFKEILLKLNTEIL